MTSSRLTWAIAYNSIFHLAISQNKKRNIKTFSNPKRYYCEPTFQGSYKTDIRLNAPSPLFTHPSYVGPFLQSYILLFTGCIYMYFSFSSFLLFFFFIHSLNCGKVILSYPQGCQSSTCHPNHSIYSCCKILWTFS